VKTVRGGSNSRHERNRVRGVVVIIRTIVTYLVRAAASFSIEGGDPTFHFIIIHVLLINKAGALLNNCNEFLFFFLFLFEEISFL